MSWFDLDVIGSMGSIKGAIEMVEHGMGVTVIAEHCVHDQLKRKSLYCFGGRKKISVTNQIYIATLDSDHQPRRVNVVIEAFRKMIAAN